MCHFYTKSCSKGHLWTAKFQRMASYNCACSPTVFFIERVLKAQSNHRFVPYWWKKKKAGFPQIVLAIHCFYLTVSKVCCLTSKWTRCEELSITDEKQRTVALFILLKNPDSFGKKIKKKIKISKHLKIANVNMSTNGAEIVTGTRRA